MTLRFGWMGTSGAIRIGVIGTGFGARVVAPLFAETEGCEVIDVVSARDSDAVAGLVRRRDVDLVSVQSPPFLHLDHVRQAIGAGRAVLCDKPFGRNAEEAAEMCRLAAEAGVLTFVNYEFRQHPARRRLRELVHDGVIGEVQHVQWEAWWSGWHPRADRPFAWSFDASRGGGWIRVWGAHQFDFLRWTFGEVSGGRAERRVDVSERVDAEGVTRGCTAETAFVATLQSESGVSILIDSSATAPVDRPSRVTVLGTDGVLEMLSDNVHEIGGWIVHHSDAGSTDVFRVEEAGDNHVLGMRGWAPLVRDAVRTGTAHPDAATFADGLAIAQLMDRLAPPG